MKVARLLGEQMGLERVILFGSLATGRFHDRSDIDLAIDGLPAGESIRAHRVTEEQEPEFEFNLVPLEGAPSFLRDAIARDGVVLWPQ